MTELPIPEQAVAGEGAIELLRVWAANKQQVISIRHDAWEDPATWGIMLADLAKHLANAYEESQGLSTEHILEKIKDAMQIELAHPTDEPEGKIE